MSRRKAQSERLALGLPPLRELDSEKVGPRAGTPPNLIRKPIKQLPMKPVKQ